MKPIVIKPPAGQLMITSREPKRTNRNDRKAELTRLAGQRKRKRDKENSEDPIKFYLVPVQESKAQAIAAGMTFERGKAGEIITDYEWDRRVGREIGRIIEKLFKK